MVGGSTGHEGRLGGGGGGEERHGTVLEDLDRLTRRLNGVLPDDVRVARCRPAPPGFDARFSAVWRRYAYRIADLDARPDPLRRNHVLTWARPLDETAMNAAATGLLGEHDFAAFCKRREGATTVRRLLELSWLRDERGTLVATVRSDAFCHSMVRALVGCLTAVGEGRRDPGWAARVLGAGVRDPAVAVVAARGLTLEEVAYPADHLLAEQATRARVVRTRG
jgi:tRNA pseudouridine38-40 synthase